MRTVGKILIVVAVAAGLASCSSPGASNAAGPAPTASAAPASPSNELPVCTADDIPVAGAPGSKPTITVPDTCSPPTQLLSKDLVVGTGPEAVSYTHLTLPTNREV